MKKVIQVLIISLFTIFSFYYANKIIDLSKKKDPIMIMIKEEKKKKEVEPVNAIIENDTILTGESGLVIDINKSYESMKKIKEFNPNLLKYDDKKPSILKKDNYDKPIKGVNTKERKIALVFRTNNLEEIEQIVYILNKNKTNGTFFTEGKTMENNFLILKELLTKYTKLGLYGYEDKYNETSLRYVKNLINKNFKSTNYCLYKDEYFLKTCIKTKTNTIKPELITNNLYNYLKENKTNGLIYEIETNKNNIKELNTTIIYLKQKGYLIQSLDELLKE